MSSRRRLTAPMQGGIECNAVLPTAPDDPQPRPSEDPDACGWRQPRSMARL